MPATNYTPIQFYRSTTSGNVPSAANLSPGELALNIADNDMTMYFENASGVVKRFFNNPAELKYPTADGTLNQGIKTDGSKTLSFGDLASAAITNNTRQAVTSSATTTINLASGQVIDLTMAANITTLSFTNVPASGTPVLVQIVVRNASSGTAYTIAWPNSVYWSGQYSATTISTVQTAPTLASGANGVTTIALLTTDGGTKWRGWVESLIPGGTSNELYAWGANANSSPTGGSGRLGLNDTISRSSPTQVGSLTNWASIAGSTVFGAAIKTDGTLWTWGYNANGELGQNNRVYTSSPVQVGALTSWSKITTGRKRCLALRTDGTMWTWGYNSYYGALGIDVRGSNRSSPVQIGALTTWSEIACTSLSAFAIKTDGTLWSWGRNNYGQLGQNENNTVPRSSPVQVGALTTWSKLSIAGGDSNHMLAITTSGSLFSWGYNTQGNLGLNDIVHKSSPVQVGALTTWAFISKGNLHSLGVTTSGTLFTWGFNSNGQLGHNDITNRSSPVQVGALTTWSKAYGGGNFTIANTTGKAMFAWGNNFTGQLGLNDLTNRSSPVQVGSASIWSKLSPSGNNAWAITENTISPA